MFWKSLKLKIQWWKEWERNVVEWKGPSIIEGNRWTCHLKCFQKTKMFDWWDIYPTYNTTSHTYSIYEFKDELTFIPSFSLGLDLACTISGKT
jgi:hypothetical protein